MAFREVRGAGGTRGGAALVGSELGLRSIAERAGVDHKTARRYVDAAVEAGLARDGGLQQLTDELVGVVINKAWDRMLPVEDEIHGWVERVCS
jgi:hypothetical protein